MNRKVPRRALTTKLLIVLRLRMTELSISRDEAGPTTRRVLSMKSICASPLAPVWILSPI
nr:hypothetical protein [Microvirga brassicacearum]